MKRWPPAVVDHSADTEPSSKPDGRKQGPKNGLSNKKIKIKIYLQNVPFFEIGSYLAAKFGGFLEICL